MIGLKTAHTHYIKGMSFKSNGNLDKLQKNLSELSGTNEVNLGDLMNHEFIQNNTSHES